MARGLLTLIIKGFLLRGKIRRSISLIGTLRMNASAAPRSRGVTIPMPFSSTPMTEDMLLSPR
ncbi:MAG TPA: hypothetical protein PKO35_06730 [Candidatus Atribacteria bacterium]|nr:hypothetical protein [Candidatus Atribacteria bacterium]